MHKTKKLANSRNKITKKKTHAYQLSNNQQANMEYLQNPICKLTPLFQVDYSKKQNIVSSCFFKMDTGGYKAFARYTNGLKNLSILVKRLLPNFRIRLFIDNTIHADPDIMAIIKKIDNVDCVVYHCPNFIEMKSGTEFHLGIFGTFVRYMPMFDFPNNDAGHVIIYDIDVTDPNLQNEDYWRLNTYNTVMGIYPNLEETYLAISGRLFHVNVKNKFIYYNKYVVPYVIASKIINFKKMPNHIFSDFLIHIHKTETRYTNYVITKELEAKKCSKYICFGLDEYFINNVVITHLLEKQMPVLIRYTYHILQPFFFYDQKHGNKQKFNTHIRQLLYGVKYSGDPMKFIDRLFYDEQNNPRSQLNNIANKVVNNYYKLIQQLYRHNDYSIICKDFVLLSLSNTIYGAAYIDRYISYFNPKVPSIIEKHTKANGVQALEPSIAKNKLISQIIS